MVKEFFICVIIVICIFLGNGITQGYSKNSVESINENLEVLKEKIYEQDEDEISKKEDEISDKWHEMFSKLAYYIEHDELEKFSINLENIKTYISLEEYNDAIKEINEGIYILNHIEDKYAFNLQNIF